MTLGAGLAAAATALAPAATTRLAATHPLPTVWHLAMAGPGPVPMITGADIRGVGDVDESPPTPASCVSDYGGRCYTPEQLEIAYQLRPLYAAGFTGAGITIAVVDPFGSPTIKADLHRFDTGYGLPDPPSIRTITPAGTPPPFNPPSGPQLGWALETTLDVDSVHAIAPEANILVVATPVNQVEGVQGFPQIVRAENYVINHHLADVISQSLLATENMFPSKASILGLRSAYQNARRHHVSVLAASGDSGATDFDSAHTISYYPYRVVGWPSSDPLVTSVGGTSVQLNAGNERARRDSTWHNLSGASGGGTSEYFPRPLFQDGERAVVGNQRGTPDISMTGDPNGGLPIYLGFARHTSFPKGWVIVGGTSESSPLFAGIVGLADQYAGKSLGDINPALYALARQTRSGIVDVTQGNNNYAGVRGYDAQRGYDLASGLGTIDGKTFVPALAAEAGGGVAPRVQPR